MLTVFAFIVVIASVLTSVWWACRNEVVFKDGFAGSPPAEDPQAPSAG